MWFPLPCVRRSVRSLKTGLAVGWNGRPQEIGSFSKYQTNLSDYISFNAEVISSTLLRFCEETEGLQKKFPRCKFWLPFNKDLLL